MVIEPLAKLQIRESAAGKSRTIKKKQAGGKLIRVNTRDSGMHYLFSEVCPLAVARMDYIHFCRAKDEQVRNMTIS